MNVYALNLFLFYVIYSSFKVAEGKNFQLSIDCAAHNVCLGISADAEYFISSAVVSYEKLIFILEDFRHRKTNYTIPLKRKSSFKILNSSEEKDNIYWPIMCAYVCQMNSRCVTFSIRKKTLCSIFYRYTGHNEKSRTCLSFDVSS